MTNTEKPSTTVEKSSSDRLQLILACSLFMLICLLMCHLTWEVTDPGGNLNVTFATLRAEGLQKQAHFLQSNVVTPFVNSDLYTLSDQLEEKVPKFVPFRGNMGKVTRVVWAVRNEIQAQTGRRTRYVVAEKPPRYKRDYYPGDDFYVRGIFKLAEKKRPVIIFLDCDRVPKNIIDLFILHLGKATPGEYLVLATSDKNWTVPPGLGGPPGLSKPLHIPTLPTIKERRKLIEACSSAWPEQPGEEILYVMANRTAALLHREKSVEQEVGTLCKLAFRNGLELHEKGRRGGEKKIDGGEISVSLKNWEDALASIISKEQSSADSG
ncbi:AAA ATPase forming ring-shaped complexes [Folsomia candida]|uniref:AAA ATPase forming ring-shaped complexes n=2 Tax=Folsomia candida TaxID=158441 RepID=A0A226D7C4_FOLCA|nr:AAA ATPase forming ring-shaped complexes [Folsomia candida]